MRPEVCRVIGRVRVGRGEVMLVPRTSRYVIDLSLEERDELERRAREVTAPWREVQRARLILYASEGLQDKEIAARLDCHPEIVSRWRRRFCAQRVEGLQDRPRAGRPRRFPPGASRRGEGARLRAVGQPWLPYNAPWRAVPWLEAISGCRVPHASGSLSGAHFVERVEDLAALPIPAHNDWLDCLRAATELIDKRPEPPPEVRAQCLQPEDVAATILFALASRSEPASRS
jgi:hypothetical protein